MIVDAIRAEGFRLSKSRTTWFWSVFFAPIVTLALGVLVAFVVKASEGQITAQGEIPPEVTAMLASTPINLATELVTAAGRLDSILLLPFVLIGVASLYAADYRWETWRLISARNTRTNLLLGKLTIAAVLALIALVVMLLFGVVETAIRASIFDRQLTFEMTGEAFGGFFALGGLSFLRVIQFTMMGMLTAVVTRSLLAALFVPLVVAVAQGLSPQLFGSMGMQPDAWLPMLVNPGMATDMLKAIASGGGAAMPDGIALKSWLSMALWTLLPLAGSIFWFNRQDLSKE
jgi:ABC-2 type transport system permease protein